MYVNIDLEGYGITLLVLEFFIRLIWIDWFDIEKGYTRYTILKDKLIIIMGRLLINHNTRGGYDYFGVPGIDLTK